MANLVIRHPKADELNELERIKREAKVEHNKEKYDWACSEIRRIIRENPYQISKEIRELPLENQRDMIQIKVNESISLEDEEAASYWIRILNNIKEQIANRDKKELNKEGNISKIETNVIVDHQQNKPNPEANVIVDHQQDKPNPETNVIVDHQQDKPNPETNVTEAEKDKGKSNNIRTIQGEKSTLIIEGNKGKRLTSEYLSINVNSSNRLLRLDLGGLLISIALLDVGSKAIDINEELDSILNEIKTEKDRNDVLEFAKSIDIGAAGSLVGLILTSMVQRKNLNEDSNEIKEDNNKIYSILKRKELLDMKKDDLQSESLKNPDDFYRLRRDYEKLIKDVEDLIYSQSQKLRKEEISELSWLIEDVEGVIRNINQYVNRMEGLANSMGGLNF